MELIDKAAVVAEIERRKHKLLDNIMFERDKEWVVRTAHQLNRIILFLDDLEVKEVDLNEEVKKYINDNFTSAEKADEFLTTVMQLDDMVLFAKHFYELGLKVQSSSVWHYVSTETPTKFGESIIIASKNNNEEDGIWLYDLIQSWEGEWNPRVNWETPVKWAYMDDLF